MNISKMKVRKLGESVTINASKDTLEDVTLYNVEEYKGFTLATFSRYNELTGKKAWFTYEYHTALPLVTQSRPKKTAKEAMQEARKKIDDVVSKGVTCQTILNFQKRLILNP